MIATRGRLELVLVGLALSTGCRDGRAAEPATVSYPVVDTGQNRCYDNRAEIQPPAPGQPFAGQDAAYQGRTPAYRDNGDGTVTDLVTGLTWQQTPDLERKATYAEAVAGAGLFSLAGYNDWRLPTIKELYSLIQFTGSAFRQVPYLATDYFAFRFGDPRRQEREIDAQYWSSTEYLGTVFGRDPAVFGVNFADGRIKGYPRGRTPRGEMRQFVRYVRGNPDYGRNDFQANNDGTITDRATGLMWQRSDAGTAMNWQQALAYAESLEIAGHDDWRLPNAKELQSIVDYSRAPDAADPAKRGPAIDPLFELTDPNGWYWTSTTHLDGPYPDTAVYVCFGRATGILREGPVDVHGAGAQRSDPKAGDPRDYPRGRGPQHDEIRIFNQVRCVRDAD